LRFDDLVRSERYFTATLLPAILFHNDLEGVRRFVALVEKKATTERNQSGDRVPKGATTYEFQNVEVMTEFHIARDLKFARLRPEEANAEPNEEDEPKKDAPDVVILAGQELVVCEGKFFSDFNAGALNKHSQRIQVHYLYRYRKIRAYRHVAIVPFVPTTDIDADVIVTWDNIRELAQELLGRDHYVTVRLANAVGRYERERGDQSIPNWNGVEAFDAMREKCRKLGDKIQVGHAGGERDLRMRDLIYAEDKSWKWREENNSGRVDPRNWLSGTLWLEIVASKHGFGGSPR
jgi:hypothetical protein